jgi:catechol 1,2-dioxygenase
MTSEQQQQDRINAIWNRVVGDLKQVVRDFKITQDELHAAGDYLDRLGQSGMSRSLLDVALALTSVATLDGHRKGTRQNLEGPYHRPHVDRPNGCLYDGEKPAGMPALRISGTVRDSATGEPLPNARLDFWQADSDGFYDRQGQHLRGVITADENGHYAFTSVLPHDYSEHDHDPLGELFRARGRHNTRAAHVHLKASYDGKVLLTTQMFMPTSAHIADDYVEDSVSDDLIVDLVKQDDGYEGVFDISLDRQVSDA